jgi:hypothetical protein
MALNSRILLLTLPEYMGYHTKVFTNLFTNIVVIIIIIII